MALTDPVLPFGLRDVKITPINTDGTLATTVDLPVSQTLSFSEAEDYEELRGDDRLVAVHGKGPTVEWELEAGGISIEAWNVFSGGTITTSGTGTTEVKDFLKKITDTRRYFRIEGQSIADDGGDVHVIIYKCKCDDTLEGEFGDGVFFVTHCSGRGLGDVNDNLYRITWNETQTAIALTSNEIQEIISDATGGTFTLTFAAQTTGALAYNISTAALTTALEGLSNIAPGDVLVTGGPGDWIVEFKGVYAGVNVAQMTAGVGSLTGGSLTIRTNHQGGS
ncbi:MAG: fibronectin type III domain-containing protein [Acidobacteria bacterium]|nr:MAG: fibronectin type III domain-containing protein [Acidobacteriota bacterium]